MTGSRHDQERNVISPLRAACPRGTMNCLRERAAEAVAERMTINDQHAQRRPCAPLHRRMRLAKRRRRRSERAHEVARGSRFEIRVSGGQPAVAIRLVGPFIDQLLGDGRFVLRHHVRNKCPGGRRRFIPCDQFFSPRIEFRRRDIRGCLIRGGFDFRGVEVLIFVWKRLLRVHTLSSRHRDRMAVPASAARHSGDE